ncbi:uncharacterized protein LOC142356994 [Convolutriloba macropyga]|uniref:uncharacterized protein LOC142356994 n=1 Tax=Convolutriloba macropyga TaxID=536237 RepID=UPI003F51D258
MILLFTIVLGVIFVEKGRGEPYGPPESCYAGLEKDIGRPILYNPNITTCSPKDLQYCYQYTHSDRARRIVREYGCATSQNHPCNNFDFANAMCHDEVKLGVRKRGLLCCSKHTKHFVPTTFSPVARCYTGTTNSSGDFVTGGDPEKCDETKSLYCVTKMKVLPNNSIVEAEFFCDLTTQNSACSEESLSSCSEMLNVSASETRERICCCSSTECNLPQYMLRSDPVTDTPFPGSPMLLYILLIVFGCIVLLGLVMMAGKQCGASSNDSIDFDDKASFDRLDFDETENDEPNPSEDKEMKEKPMTKMLGKDKFDRVEIDETDDTDGPSPSDKPMTETATV